MNKGRFKKGQKAIHPFPKGHIPWSKGKTGVYSDKHLKKMSLLRKGKPLKDETKKKMSLAHKGKKFSKEHRKNLSISKTGKNNTRWIKDRSKLTKDRSSDPFYVRWSKTVRKRDKYKCRLSSDECKGKLEAHHIFNWIDYPELKYLENNGICLCQFHHPQGRKNEERMRPIFQELVG